MSTTETPPPSAEPAAPNNAPAPRQVLRTMILFEAFVGVFAWGVGWLVDCRPEAFVAWSWTAVGQGVVAAVPMLVLFWLTLRFPIGPLVSLKKFVEVHVLPIFDGARWSDLAVVSALAGVGEEFLFRGVLQEGLSRLHDPPGGIVLGIAVASLMFGLAHALTPVYAVLATLISVYLGVVFVATDNLLPPIVAHAVYDFIALWLLVRRRAAASCCHRDAA